MDRRLIVYAKRPLPGYAKTRLGTTIGMDQSAGVYARLLYAYLLDLIDGNVAGAKIELSVASGSDVPFFAKGFPEVDVHPQIEGDLGERMWASFQSAFTTGAETVILTGSDIPGLDSALVRAAFDILETAAVVIGPAADGGYYLIGMRAPGAPLFEGIAWSSSRVLAQTEALASMHRLAIVRLPELSDLDTALDYERWQQGLALHNRPENG